MPLVDPSRMSEMMKEAQLAKSQVGPNDIDNDVAMQKKLYYDGVNYSKARVQMAYAVNQGLITPEQAHDAIINGHSNWIEKALHQNNEHNNGGFLETVGAVAGIFGHFDASVTRAGIDFQAYGKGAGVTVPEGVLKTSRAIGGVTTLGLSEALGRGLSRQLYGSSEEWVHPGPMRIGFSMSGFMQSWHNQETYARLNDQYGNQGFVTGLVGDIALDPMTWLTMGVGAGKVVSLGNKAEIAQKAVASGARVAPTGAVKVTLTKLGSEYYRMAASAFQQTFLKEAVASNAQRLARGEAETHLLDRVLADPEMDHKIATYMVENFEKLKALRSARIMAGGEGKLSKALSILPGTDEFAQRGYQVADKMRQAITGRKVSKIVSTGIEDLFEETVPLWRKELGPANLFGALKPGAANRGMEVMTRTPMVGTVFSKFFDIFDHGWDAPHDVVERGRLTKMAAEHDLREAQVRYAATRSKLTDQEAQTVSRLVEKGYIESMTARREYKLVDKIDRLPEVFDPMTNKMVPNPNFNLPVRDAFGKVVTENRLVDGIPTQKLISDEYGEHIIQAAKEVRQHLDDIEHFEKVTHGLDFGHVDNYLTHIYRDPATREAVRELVARRNNVDSIHAGSRYSQARAISSIAAAESLFGMGALELDCFKVLDARKAASLHAIAMKDLFEYTAEHHGIETAVAQSLRNGAPTEMMRAWAVKMGTSVHKVLPLDQTYKRPDGRLVLFGFKDGKTAFNRKLAAYLRLSPTESGRFSKSVVEGFDATTSPHDWATANSIPVDARLHSVIRDGTSAGLPEKFSYIDEYRTFVAGEGAARAKEPATHDVDTALKMLDDPSHIGWKLVVKGRNDGTPSLERVHNWIKGLDAYTREYLETPIEGFHPRVRDVAIDAFERLGGGAGGGVSKTEIEVAQEELKVFKQQIKTQKLAMATNEALGRTDIDGAQALHQVQLRHEALLQRLAEMGPKASEEVRKTRAYAKFHSAMDKMATPLEVRGVQPQLPTPFVHYLRQARRSMDILTDEVPYSKAQALEMDRLSARLGLDGTRLRQVCRLLFDKDTPQTAGEMDRVIGALQPTAGMKEDKEVISVKVMFDRAKRALGVSDIGAELPPKMVSSHEPVSISLPAKNSADEALYPEMQVSNGDIPMSGAAPSSKSDLGSFLKDDARSQVASGNVPATTFAEADTGLRGTSTIARKGVSAREAKLQVEVDRVVKTARELLPKAVEDAKDRWVRLVDAEHGMNTPLREARLRLGDAKKLVNEHADELKKLLAEVREKRKLAREAAETHSAVRKAVSEARTRDPAFEEYRQLQAKARLARATGTPEEAPALRDSFEAMKEGDRFTEMRRLYKVGRDNIKARREESKFAGEAYAASQRKLQEFFTRTGIDSRFSSNLATGKGVAKQAVIKSKKLLTETGVAQDIMDARRAQRATLQYGVDLERAAAKAEAKLTKLRSQLAKVDSAMFAADDMGRPVGESLKGGAKAPLVQPVSSAIEVYLPRGTAKYLREMSSPSVDPTWHPQIQRIFRGYDEFTRMFKATLIAPFTGSMNRDAIGGAAISGLHAGFSLFHPDVQGGYWRLIGMFLAHSGLPEKLGVSEASRLKFLEQAGEHVMTSRTGRAFTVKDIFREATRRGIGHAGPSAETMSGIASGAHRVAGAVVGAAAGSAVGQTAGVAAENAYGYDAGQGSWYDPSNVASLLGAGLGAMLGGRGVTPGGGKINALTDAMQTGWKPMLRAREYVSDIPFRAALFVHALHDTGSIPEAANVVYRHLNDWNSFSVFERRYIKRMFPFYSWTKLAFMQTGRAMFENPGRVTAILKTVKGWNTVQHVDPEDIGDLYSDSLVVGGKAAADGERTMYRGAGLPIEDVASLVDTDHKAQWLLQRTNPIVKMFTEGVISNEDSRTGQRLFTDPGRQIYESKMSNGEGMEQAPKWLKAVVGFQERTVTSDPVVHNEHIRWLLDGILTSRFTNIAQQIRDHDHPETLNMNVLARALLGVQQYRFDPKTGRHYENVGRIQALETVLSNVGAIRHYEGWSDADEREKARARRSGRRSR